MDRLVCRECAKNYSLNEEIWRCSCGGLLDLDFQPFFPINRIRQRKPTLWRYREAILLGVKALRLLGVPPDAPNANVILPPDEAEIREET